MAEAQIKKEDISQDQMQQMQQMANQLNTIIQRQPELKNHAFEVRLQENGVAKIYIVTTDNSKVNVEKMNEVYKENISEVIDNKNVNIESKVAFAALFQEGGVTSKQLKEYQKDGEKFILFFKEKLNNSKLGIGDSSTQDKTGDGQADMARQAFLYTEKDWLQWKKKEELPTPIEEKKEGYVKLVKPSDEKEEKTREDLKKQKGLKGELEEEGMKIQIGLTQTPNKKYDPKEIQSYLEINLTDSELKDFAVLYSRNLQGTQKFYEDLADDKIEGMKPEDFNVKREDDKTITITYKYKGKNKTQVLVDSNGINMDGHADFCHLNQNNDKTNPKGMKAREKMYEYQVKEITKDERGKEFYNNLKNKIKEAHGPVSMRGVLAGIVSLEEKIYSERVAEKMKKFKEQENA